MSDKDHPTEAVPDADGAEVEAQQPSPGAQLEGDVGELRRELEEARARADEHWDRLMRASAELENVRKRAEREVEMTRKYALERFATELLAVRDSLEMGLGAARESESDGHHVQGMELTLRMLAGVMEKFGITVLDPVGQPFNPEYHEAMSTQPSAEAAPNTVLKVMQKGYMLQDRLLRPAMVVVARALPAGDGPGGAQP